MKKINFQSEVNKVISLDGNFGLVHKKSSGEGAGLPRRKGRFFLDQDQVDAFVSTYGVDTKKQSIVSLFFNEQVDDYMINTNVTETNSAFSEVRTRDLWHNSPVLC